MEKINDLTIYNSRMAKGMKDKLFFLPFLTQPPLLIDYGCADGTLAKYIKEIYPDAVIYGYDIDENMLKIAKKELGNDNVYLFHSREFDKLKLIKQTPSNIFQYTQQYKTHDEILNLSSVIHEVYSYCNKEDIEEFWKNVFSTGFDKIAIRDMSFQAPSDHPSKFKDFEEFTQKFMEGIHKNGLEGMWEDYRKVNPGKLSYKIMTHFLLKYHYKENWDRESQENYFSLDFHEFKEMIPEEYEIIYESEYLLPYVKDYVMQEFGIELDCTTHYKILLQKSK